MNVRVHSKNMSVGDDLKEVTIDKVRHAGRIFDDESTMTDVEFTLHQNPRMSEGRFNVEITSGIAGQLVRVEARAQDDVAALDIAVDKFERQLRKLKERLIQRNRKSSNKHLNVDLPRTDDSEDEGPAIVRTKRFAMRPMTPEEAALQMEMLGHDFFFFMNAETGGHGVIYHRRDGSLGLIEPE